MNAMPVRVSKEVGLGLDAMKDQLSTQMKFVTFTIYQLRELGYPEAAQWVDENRQTYIKAVENGWMYPEDEPTKPESGPSEKTVRFEIPLEPPVEEIDEEPVITVDEIIEISDEIVAKPKKSKKSAPKSPENDL
jgi:hypothetical protein